MFASSSTLKRAARGWPAYWKWNQAIADTVFSAEVAGLPVYLDLEEELLDRLAQHAGAAGDPKAELAAAVKATLELGPGRTSVFRRHEALVRAWRHKPSREVPPTLALLALLSLAAEAMRSGEGMSAHNYYGRLCKLLDVSDESLKEKLERDYRKCAQDLWGALNAWLLAWEGERGLLTAEALGHPHIGLPLSQALVRAGDRHRLHACFAVNGLPPGAVVPPDEMRQLMEVWMDHEPPPVSSTLHALWKRHEAARERIASVACLELATWSGIEVEAANADAPGRVAALRLVALLRRVPQVRLELSLAVRLPGTDLPAEVTFVPASSAAKRGGGTAEVVFESLGEGWLQLGDPELFDTESLVGGTVRLETGAPPLAAERKPRRLIPLRWDESLQLYVEAERVHLGEDTMLVCRVAIADHVEALLEAIARPGFSRQPLATVGLAEWVAFTDVQVLAAPDLVLAEGEDDLRVLLPAIASQVLVAGGLELPGRARKWSSLLPPEVRVVVPPGGSTQVAVFALAPGEEPQELADVLADGAVVVALQDRQLPDGDYLVETREPGAKKPQTRTRIRLRSADTPVPATPGAAPRLVYSLEQPAGLGPLTAVVHADHRRYAEGARVHGADPGRASYHGQRLPASPPWSEAPATQPQVGADAAPRLSLGAVEPASCVVTGAHRFELPDYRGVGPSLRPHSGRCRTCGLVKWFGGGSRYQTATDRVKAADQPAPRTLPPAARLPDHIAPVHRLHEVPWDAGVDALCHLGSGSAAHLERIALQLRGERLFAHQFTQLLEALGHLDVERDPHSLRLRQWQVPSPVLAGLPSGAYVLAGWRSSQLIAALKAVVAAEGGRLQQRRQPDAPLAIVVSGLTAEQAARVTTLPLSPDGRRLSLQPDAAASLATALAPLGQVLDELPRVTLPSAEWVERWDTLRARWVQVGSVDRPGAYKLRGPLVRYGVCTQQDLDQGRFAIGLAEIVKHMAALLAGTVHMAYDEPSARLLVPLGAALPGLYGRAAVLCSGRAPTTAAAGGQPLLIYHDVPPDIAHAIAHAMAH